MLGISQRPLQPTISVSSVTPPPEESSLSGKDTSVQDTECLPFAEQVDPGAELEQRTTTIGASLASAGLLFGAAATTNDLELEVWSTRLSGRRGGLTSKSNASPLVTLLGEEKFQRVSELTVYARTVPPSERCFFLLLLLVTLIYALGILTALVLLCFHMWIFK